ncbi:ATP phosphoribosyltransferase [Candidatus Zinderia endosymbiont of Aphrophora alni]|uniref:ATP phosphoribosyltransferase n=1 Tax=Candidatus Zinderia endosymbiont of Aphrophora alni TaxID=3077951 RepID=UPI0030D25FCA
MIHKLVIALSKGRILKETILLLNSIGIFFKKKYLLSRKLILKTNNSNIKIILVRAFDVPIYVNYGVADLGIVGRDVLFEHNLKNLYHLTDLKISKCRLSIISKSNFDYLKFINSGLKLCVATKYINITRKYFLSKNININLIKLSGSLELSPLIGLSNIIVDLIDTGLTLKENNLIEIKCILKVSSQLIINKSSLKFKNNFLQSIFKIFKKNINL